MVQSSHSEKRLEERQPPQHSVRKLEVRRNGGQAEVVGGSEFPPEVSMFAEGDAL